MGDPDIVWKDARSIMVRLSEEEVRARGELLASAVKKHGAVVEAHAAEKKAMAELEKSCTRDIARLAEIVNDRREERIVDVELRANLKTGMVDVVRLDTGELLEQRVMEEKERLRLQGRLPLGEPIEAPE
jgi:hypothetical protein